ncbi:acyltransferase family protein [Faecalicatena sp. Marseille-Q4148]|nr:acyltransferase family protein [Faecalicatena sp. Marseille-Q4148]
MGKEITFSKKDTLRLKGIAICMMLFHHLFGFPDRIPYKMIDISFIGGDLSYFLASFSKLCVMIYVFLGGYGNYYTFYHCTNISETSRCLVDKIKKLYLNYWKVFLIFIPLLYILKYYVVDIGVFIKGFIGISHMYNNEWWFFFPYVLVLCFYAVGFKIFFIRKGFWIEFVMLFVLGGCWEKVGLILESSVSSTIILVIISGLNFLPAFLCGSFFAKYNFLSKIKNMLRRCKLFCLSTVMGVFVLMWIRYNFGDGYDWIMAAVFVILILPITLMKESNLINKILVKLGSQSMSMWLIHTFFCYQFFQNEIYFTRIPIVIFFVLLIVSYASSVVIGKLWRELNKPVEKIRMKVREIN